MRTRRGSFPTSVYGAYRSSCRFCSFLTYGNTYLLRMIVKSLLVRGRTVGSTSCCTLASRLEYEQRRPTLREGALCCTFGGGLYRPSHPFPKLDFCTQKNRIVTFIILQCFQSRPCIAYRSRSHVKDRGELYALDSSQRGERRTIMRG